MSKYERFTSWLDRYRAVAFDLLRIYLGIGLFVRGVLFLLEPASYQALLGPSSGWLTSTGLFYVVSIIHVIGGAMMTVGFLTRLAALIQIPILLGAVFLVPMQRGLFTATQSFEFSALVLFLLVLVFLHGAERWSVDTSWNHRLSPFRNHVGSLSTSSDVAFSLLRIYLGIGLFVRGAIFIADSQRFMELVDPSSGAMLTSIALIHYVALVHLAGGLMLAAGFLTRLAALFQIPILLGAVFLVHFQGGLMAPNQSLEFSVLVLFVLVLLFLYGSGRWSADYYLSRNLATTEAEYAGRLRVSDTPRPLPPASARPAGGGTAVLTRPETKQKVLTCPLQDDCPVVAQEHPRDHPWVVPTRRYSTIGGFYFLAGITGPPKEIVFNCERCGKVVERSRDPTDLAHYRYR